MDSKTAPMPPNNTNMHEEDLYRALFEQTNDAVFILNLEGRYLTVNRRAQELFGYDQDAFATMAYVDVVADSQSANADAVIKQLLAGEIVPVYERVFQRSDGSTFVGEVNSQLVIDNAGDPLHIQSVVRDITERKTIEDDLYYHAHLLENVSDAIISTDMLGRIRTWNRAAEKLYGWDENEVFGKDIDEVLETRLGGVGHQEQIVKEQYFMRGHWSNEVVQSRRNGDVIFVLSSVSLLREAHSRPVGMVIVNHDITARKHAEYAVQDRADQMTALRQIDAEISSTLELDQVLLFSINASVSLCAADNGFIVLLDGNEVKRVHGYGKYKSLEKRDTPLTLYGISRRIMRRVRPELVQNVDLDPDYSADIAETKSLMAFPLVSRDRVIGVMVLESSRRGIFTQEVFEFINLLVNRLAAAIDNAWLYGISQQQLEELKNLYAQVSKLEQLKTDMIRIASHDLRNPVGLINGYIELLRMDVLDRLTEAEIDYIDSIARSVYRMQGIIDDILSLERIQQVAQDKISDPIDLVAMVNKAVHSHQPEAEAKSQYIGTHFPEQGEAIVNGDPAQLYEALSNLISNAIKYTPEQGEIVVSVFIDKVSIRVEVADNGYGIPEDQQDRLFEPFYRPQVAETSEITGTGLGLHLVKNIIERLDGELLFSSEYGRGSVFGFRLPMPGLLKS
ncbi:MAG: PAS domain S-box protein [Aggregatilineales bacterium]